MVYVLRAGPPTQEELRGKILETHGVRRFGLGEKQGFHDFIVNVIRKDKGYVKEFEVVFGVKPEQITIEHVVKAIASFERTVISGDSPFDRYVYGGDKTALSESAIRGLELYKGKARCQECHAISESYAIFTDNKFHNLGVGFKKIQPRLPGTYSCKNFTSPLILQRFKRVRGMH